ncbi:50S ribosomal protein L20 [Patescibacteria group bacterium]|nr:50S ribosomal protein L20 [Patescibacteria group bacterium]
MTRIKRGVTAHRRHHKMVKAAKGYRGLRSKTFAQAKNAVMKAGTNAYRDRRLRKRTFRRLWITRINAACRVHGVQYSRFVYGLTIKKILVDRKILADMAVHEPDTFKAVLDKAMGQRVQNPN